MGSKRARKYKELRATAGHSSRKGLPAEDSDVITSGKRTCTKPGNVDTSPGDKDSGQPAKSAVTKNQNHSPDLYNLNGNGKPKRIATDGENTAPVGNGSTGAPARSGTAEASPAREEDVPIRADTSPVRAESIPIRAEDALKGADATPASELQLETVGRAEFFGSEFSTKADLHLMSKYLSASDWTEDDLKIAHRNVMKIAHCDDPELVLKAADMIRKTVVDSSKLELARAKHELELSKPKSGPDGHMGEYHQHLHLSGENAQTASDTNGSPDRLGRVHAIAERLGIKLSIVGESGADPEEPDGS